MCKLTFHLALLALAVTLEVRLSAQTYFHDEVGRLVQVSYPDGQGIRYDYDEADNVVAVETLTLPEGPSNLTVNRSSGTTVTLTWTDNSTNETDFVIERRTLGESVWNQIAMVPTDSQHYTDATATAGLDYEYRVSAQGAEGLSAYSNTQSTAINLLMISSARLRESTQGLRIELSFSTAPGNVYRIETTSDLAAPAWQSASFSTSLDGTANEQTINGDGSPQAVYFDLSSSSVFFRLRQN